MRTIRAGRMDPKDAAEKLAQMVRTHPQTVETAMRRHGAVIEAKAARITPVDTGFLRRANTVRVDIEAGDIVLTAENRMIYAVWQHDFPHRHKLPQARDHFIALPFAAELPKIVTDIIINDMEALQ